MNMKYVVGNYLYVHYSQKEIYWFIQVSSKHFQKVSYSLRYIDWKLNSFSTVIKVNIYIYHKNVLRLPSSQDRYSRDSH